MRRRDTGRDVWLTLRMVVVCIVLAVVYGALAATSVLPAIAVWSTNPLIVFVPAIVAILFLVHFQRALCRSSTPVAEGFRRPTCAGSSRLTRF